MYALFFALLCLGTNAASVLNNDVSKRKLASDCRVDIHDQTYDLCPLLRHQGQEVIKGEKLVVEEGRGRWKTIYRDFSISFSDFDTDPNV
jgi:hypothetical protein